MTTVVKTDDYAALVGGLRWTRATEELVRCAHDSWPLQTKLAANGHHEFLPDIVVFPRTAAEVAQVLRAASADRIPVTPRGLGSSVTGQPLPTRGGIVLDLSDLLGDLTLDETNLTVTAGAGWNGGLLEKELRARGFSTGHSPQSLHRSTVGGWVATLASGQLSSLYGGIEHLLAQAEVVLSDGTVLQLGALPRAAMGPDLTKLFIGSEGTLGVVTKVTLRIHPLPEHEEREAFRLAADVDAIALLREIAQSGVHPAILRLYDQAEARHVLNDPDYAGWLLLLASEGEATTTIAAHEWQRAAVQRHGGESLGAGPVDRWIERRYDFSAVERILATEGGYAETIEVAHTWSDIGRLYDELTSALGELVDTVYGHYSHIYPQGSSLYVIVSGFAASEDGAIARLRQVWETAMSVALANGAVLSHHHGAGLARAPYVRGAMADSRDVLDRIKHALDPSGILNPGKLGLLEE